jgi:hypothetical protein
MHMPTRLAAVQQPASGATSPLEAWLEKIRCMLSPRSALAGATMAC